ncbi:hypothetical protein ACXZ65_12850 [Streptomyces aculeolatus]
MPGNAASASEPAVEEAAPGFGAGLRQDLPHEGDGSVLTEDLLEELEERLESITASGSRNSAASLRRVAEIVEWLDGEEAARPWWLHAAAAGDEISIAVVRLDEANSGETHGDRPDLGEMIEEVTDRNTVLLSGRRLPRG